MHPARKWSRAAAFAALVALAGCSELCGLAVGSHAASEEAAAHRFRGAQASTLWTIVREEVRRNESTAVLPESVPPFNSWSASEWAHMNDLEDRRIRARLSSDDDGATIHVEIEAESRAKSSPDGPPTSLGSEMVPMLAVIERADPAGYAAMNQRISERGAAAQQGCRCVEEQFPVNQPPSGGAGTNTGTGTGGH